MTHTVDEIKIEFALKDTKSEKIGMESDWADAMKYDINVKDSESMIAVKENYSILLSQASISRYFKYIDRRRVNVPTTMP